MTNHSLRLAEGAEIKEFQFPGFTFKERRLPF